jgi:hypothetical protein
MLMNHPSQVTNYHGFELEGRCNANSKLIPDLRLKDVTKYIQLLI